MIIKPEEIDGFVNYLGKQYEEWQINQAKEEIIKTLRLRHRTLPTASI